MKVTFLGGAKVVTGAQYLVETNAKKILVECGMFQGSEELADLNFQPFEYDPASIDYVFITHSHLDHCGRVPRLVREGFRGKIFCTAPTKDIMLPALEDSARVSRETAEELNYPPLYEERDVHTMLSLVEPQPYGKKITLTDSISFTLRNAGHILGSAMIELKIIENKKMKRLLFTGDLGNCPNPLLPATDAVKRVDYVFIEAAYGNRNHESAEDKEVLLQKAILDVIKRSGVLLIPSFAIERTQELLYEINNLVEHKKIPPIPIYIDSPLATKITRIYKQHQNEFNTKTKRLIASGDDIFHFPLLKFTETREESKKINHAPNPKIIIAGAGMSTGGRILYHEERYLSDPNNLFLVVGFQVEGTTGRKILMGEPAVRINGHLVKNKIEVRAIGGYSAHADQRQLVNFIKKITPAPKQIFIVQGEYKGARGLQKALKQKLDYSKTVIPKYEDVVEL